MRGDLCFLLKRVARGANRDARASVRCVCPVLLHYVRKFVGNQPPSGSRLRRIRAVRKHHVRTYRVRTGPNRGSGLRRARMRVESNTAEIVGEAVPHFIAQFVWQRAAATCQRFFNDGRCNRLS